MLHHSWTWLEDRLSHLGATLTSDANNVAILRLYILQIFGIGALTSRDQGDSVLTLDNLSLSPSVMTLSDLTNISFLLNLAELLALMLA